MRFTPVGSDCSSVGWLLCCLWLTLAGCSRWSDSGPESPPEPSLPAPLLELEPRYRTAVSNARRWLDDLVVDPFALRSAGIKGKKKLVEFLGAYYRLWQVAPPADKPRLLHRIREIVAVTYTDRYHDMATISDRWFKQDATSYLRGAVLMERLGLDTRRYREEIWSINGRLNDHMPTRGPHQRRTFHWYYQTFSLMEPFPLADALAAGVIARRTDPASMSNDDAYSLTHEIYGPYEYGDRLDVDPFDAAAKAYLRTALDTLGRRYLAEGNPDLAAEILECLHYVRMQDEPIYLDLVRYLLDAQNTDGSWGVYERRRVKYGPYVKQGFQLHTTKVAMGALVSAFERRVPGKRP